MSTTALRCVECSRIEIAVTKEERSDLFARWYTSGRGRTQCPDCYRAWREVERANIRPIRFEED